MKQFMDFMRKSYQHYYIIDEQQSWIPSDRCTVFAPSYNNRQRWLWDEENEHSFDECMAGNIDIVLTKSISRFARNTMDCLKYVRMLKERGISVIFEKENVDTMDTKGEFLLTILASLAHLVFVLSLNSKHPQTA